MVFLITLPGFSGDTDSGQQRQTAVSPVSRSDFIASRGGAKDWTFGLENNLSPSVVARC